MHPTLLLFNYCLAVYRGPATGARSASKPRADLGRQAVRPASAVPARLPGSPARPVVPPGPPRRGGSPPPSLRPRHSPRLAPPSPQHTTPTRLRARLPTPEDPPAPPSQPTRAPPAFQLPRGTCLHVPENKPASLPGSPACLRIRIVRPPDRATVPTAPSVGENPSTLPVPGGAPACYVVYTSPDPDECLQLAPPIGFSISIGFAQKGIGLFVPFPFLFFLYGVILFQFVSNVGAIWAHYVFTCCWFAHVSDCVWHRGARIGLRSISYRHCDKKVSVRCILR